MKKYEEFTVDVASLKGIQKLLAKEILHALQPLMVGAQLFTVDETLIGSMGNTKVFRKETDITGITNTTEGQELPDVVSATQEVVEITPVRIGGKETITAEAIQYADYNVINDVKLLLARAFAKFKDERYWKVICNETSITETVTLAEAANWVDLSNGKILAIDSVTRGGSPQTIGVDFLVDFFKGALWFETPGGVGGETIDVTYRHAGDIAGIDAAETAVASYKDLVAAKSQIISAYGKPDTAVLNQNQIADLLMDDKFLAAAASASGERVILNGQINRASGLAILESQMMYEGVIAVLQKKTIGYDCYKERLSTEVEKIQGRAGDVWVKIWESSMPGITRKSLICLVFNTHRYAKKKP